MKDFWHERSFTQVVRLCRSVLVAATLLASPVAFAQETSATISGRVLAADGTPVDGAEVEVVHVASGTTRRVTTGADGRFSVPGLRIGGPFKVTSSKDGFESAWVEDVRTVIGQPTALELAMESSSIQEVVVAGTRVRAAEIGLTSEFSSQDIANLPSVSRDIKSIVRLDPKVIIDPTNSDAIEIAGTNNRFNSLTVDGIRQSDDFGLNNNGYPTQRSPVSLDAVEAVSVRTAPFDVEDAGFMGGTVTVVTKSGTNDFSGSAYYYDFSDSRVGGRSKEDALEFQFDEKTWGATLGGPILEDKLFFFLSYEELDRTAPQDFGPAGSGAPVEVGGVSLADYQEIVGIARDVYGFDAGELSGSLPEKDRKILAKIDWNINDQHRLSLAYQNSEGNGIIPSNMSASQNRVSSPSHWYNRSFPLEQTSLQVFSNWTDNFSTEFKVGRKQVEGIQASLRGTDFAEMQIITSDGGTVYIGPDTFRHANALTNDLDQFKFKGEYRLGDHTLKAGVELEKLDVFNLFVPTSQGQYFFASIDDFRDRIAEEMVYQNAVTNNADDGAGAFSTDTLSFYIQDRWQITPTFSIQGGVRFDQFKSGDRPALNQSFLTRYGFSNQSTFDGLELISPRFGFTWEMNERTTLSGGFGLFGGGTPNVWLSNSFSNTGVATDLASVDSGSPADLQAAALTNVDGFEIPIEVQNLLEAGDGPVNALDPDFDIPSSWRYNLSVNHTFDFGPLGDDWRVGADFIYTDVKNGVVWRDLRREATATAPDGRPIYSVRPGDTRPTGTFDLLLSNTSGGKGTVATFDVSKSWTNAAGRFDLYFGYSHQDIKDVNPGTSSTATSNWDSFGTQDFNDPVLATSNYEIKHRFPLSLTWRKAFFGDYDTALGLFIERRSGRPFSYTFGGSSSVFGDPRQSSRNRQLFYVPENMDDVAYAGGLTPEALDAFIENSALDKYRGRIAPRNAFNSPWITTADLRLSQELPAFFKDVKGIVSLDIENVANLINSDWGRLSQVSFVYTSPVVQVNGITDDGRYIYAPMFGETGPRSVVNSLSALPSVWRIQLGVKFQF